MKKSAPYFCGVRSARYSTSHFRERGNVFFAIFGAVALVGALGFAAGSIMKGPMRTMANVSQRAEAEGEIISNMQLVALSIADMSDQDCDKDGTVEPPSWTIGSGPTGGGLVPTTIKSSNMTDPWGTPYGYCVWDHGTKVEGDTAIGGECNSDTDGNGASERLQGLDKTQHAAGIVANQPTIAIVSAGPDRTFDTTCRNWVDADIDSGSENGVLTDAGDLPLISKVGDDLTLTFNYAEASVATSSQWRLKEETGDTAGDSVAEITDDKVELGGDTVQIGDMSGVDTGLLDLSLGGLKLPRDPGDDSITGACVNAGLNDQQMRFNTSTSPSTLEICTNGTWSSMGGAATGQYCAPYTPVGVTFDGTNDYLNDTSAGYTAVKRFTMSFWMRANTLGTNKRILVSNNNDLNFRTTSTNGFYLNFQASGAGDALTFSTPGSLFTDTDWHHVLISANLNGADPDNVIMYFDNNPVILTVSAIIDTPIEFDSPSIGIGDPVGSAPWDGDLADFYMDMGTSLDISNDTIRAKFINTDGTAQYLGAKGELPKGSSPEIYLGGSINNWPNNKGTGTGFVQNETITLASQQPPTGTNCSGSGRGFCSAYTPNGVTFDGTNDRLRSASAISTTDEYEITFSAWVRRNSMNTMEIIGHQNSRVRIFFSTTSSRLTIALVGTSGGTSLFTFDDSIISSTDWMHLLFSYDAQSGTHAFYANDTLLTPVSVAYDNNPIDFNNGYITVGARSDNNIKLNGDLADVWLSAGTYLDLSLESNRRKFISSSGMPVYLGPSGAEGPGIQPNLYLSGNTDNWHNNKGTGGGTFTEVGALTTANNTLPEGDNCMSSGSGDMVSGLEGHWKLDETSGTNIVDSVGGNDGTFAVANPKSTKGIDGNAFLIGHQNNYFEVPYNYNFSSHTVCTWLNYQKDVSLSDILKFDGGANNWGLTYRPTVDTIRVNDNISSGPGEIYTSFVALNNWFHVCAGINDAQENFLYINGAPQENNIAANATLADFTVNNLRIGHTGGSDRMLYLIDDIRLYDRTLSDDDVLTLYNSYDKFPGQLDDTDLIAHFKLDESSGTSAINAIDNSSHTMQGGLNADGTNNAAGINGGALKFDGSNDYIDLSSIPTITTNTLTLAAWVNLNTIENGDGVIFTRAGPAGGLNFRGNVTDGFEVGYHWQGQPYSYGFDTGLTAYPNIWQFVALTISPDEATLYIGDNISLKSVTNVQTHNSYALSNFRIGEDTMATRHIDGLIDEARIYTRTLTPAEMQSLYEITGQNYILGPQNNGQAFKRTFTSSQTLTQTTSSDAYLRDYGLIIDKQTAQSGDEAMIGFMVGNSPTDDDITGAGIGAIKNKSSDNTNALVFKTQNADGEFNTRATLNETGLGIAMGGPENVYAALQIRGILGDTWNGDFSAGLLVNGGPDTLIEANLNSFRQSSISTSLDHACAIMGDGEIYCWGDNTYGKLGINLGGGTYDTPQLISENGPWKSITVNNDHACALKTDGRAYCWGRNSYGQLGTDGAAQSNLPQPVLGDYRWAQISTGDAHTCGIRTNGRAYCWGLDQYGELGNGPSLTANMRVPTPISGSEGWIDINGGYRTTCGIKSDGTAWCWGEGQDGKLGDGFDTSRDEPTLVTDAGPWQKVTTGGDSSCGIKTDGTGWCWGRNAFSALGVGYSGGTHFNPTAINSPDTWKIIESGTRHACGIKTDGTAWCWGNETYGELGNGTDGGVTSPTQISDAGSWDEIDVAGYQSCGIKSDGTAWCWGEESYGEFGNGATTGPQIDPSPNANAGPWKLTPDTIAIPYPAYALGYLGMNGTDNAESSVLYGSKLVIADTDTDGENKTDIMSIDGNGQAIIHERALELTSGDFISTSDSGNLSYSNKLIFQKARGSQDVPEIVQVGDIIGAVTFSGHSDTITNDANAAIYTRVASAPSVGNIPTEMHFSVDINGNATSTGTKMMITNDHKLAIGTTSVPTHLAHVEGVAAFANGLRFGDDASCVGASDDGTIKYDLTAEQLQYCTMSGTPGWYDLSVDAGGTFDGNTDEASILLGWGEGGDNKLAKFDASATDETTPIEIANIYGVEKIATGHRTSCVLTKIGDIWCWGSRVNYGLGDGSASGSVNVPQKLNHPDGLKWRALDIGHTGAAAATGCAIDTRDRAYCWGKGTYGVMGDGSTLDNQTPGLVSGGHRWSSIDVGWTVCGVTTDGDGYCWGKGDLGELGNGGTSNSSSPQLVSGSHTWRHISTGEGFTCGVTTDGGGYCWGDKEFGSVGDGTSTGTQTIPKKLGVGIKWKSITAERDVCGITEINTMLCWGTNAHFGNYTGGTIEIIAERVFPTPTGIGIKWDKIESGYSHTCALTTEGKAYCWGDNDAGELGIGNTTRQTEPTAVLSDLRFSEISAGSGHVLALTDPQKSKVSYGITWGDDNTTYALGNDEALTDQSVPRKLYGINDIAEAIINQKLGCVIRQNGDGYCWGDNSLGQLGDNTNTNREQPTLVTGSYKWKSFSGGTLFVCGITHDNVGYCWGDNSNAQLGIGVSGSTYNAPQRIAGGHSWKLIETGSAFACGINTENDAYCWGTEDDGELGDGGALNDVSLTPTIVPGGYKWQKLRTNIDTVCGLTVTGDAYCWGSDVSGNIGNGGALDPDQPSPVAVTGGFKFVDIGGRGAFCGIVASRDAYCWGGNPQGQMGTGATGTHNREPSIIVTGGHKWKKIDGSAIQVCGMTVSNELYCWGKGSDSAIGDGNTSDRNVPTKVALQTNISDFSSRVNTIAIVRNADYDIAAKCDAGDIEFANLYTSSSNTTLSTDTIEISGVTGSCPLTIASDSANITIYLNTVAQSGNVVDVENGDSIYLDIESGDDDSEVTTYITIGDKTTEHKTYTKTKTVFYSSTTNKNGSTIGGISGADALCHIRAADAGLNGLYKAWISDSTAYPAARFSHWNYEYKTPDGSKVSDDWEDLTDATLDNAINKFEDGSTQSSGSSAASNTTSAGFPIGISDNNHCYNWSGGGATDGNFGYIHRTNSQWTDFSTAQNCGVNGKSVYCFEQ